MKKLIVNADDFAIHTLVNQAIIKAHQVGVLTSTSILANGPAFEEAIALATANPSLGVGVHLCLVGELPALSDPQAIPTLLDPSTGRLYSNYLLFTKKYLTGQINKQEIYRELALQVSKVKNTGISITHIDSHQHMHMLPKIDDIAVRICRENGISKSRVSQEGLFFTGGYPYTVGRYLGKVALSLFSLMAARTFKSSVIKHPEHFYGMLAGGNMQERYLLKIIERIPTGTNEIMLHPGMDKEQLTREFGFEYNWQLEYEALISSTVREAIHNKSIKLISFKDL